MTLFTVRLRAGAGIDRRQVMNGTDRGGSHAMERLREAIETRVMTISTRRRRTSKQGQILRGGNQIRVRGRMTGRTRAAVNLLHYIARVTGRTRCICRDRGVTQGAAVRCMVVHVWGQ